MAMQLMLLLLKFFFILGTLILHGSAGYNLSPATFSAISPSKETKSSVGYYGKSLGNGAPSPEPLLNGSIIHFSKELPPNSSRPVPQVIHGLVPSMPPDPESLQKSAPLPQTIKGFTPSPLPNAPQRRTTNGLAASTPRKSPLNPPTSSSLRPRSTPFMSPEPHMFPKSSPPTQSMKGYGMPVATPPKESFNHLSPMSHTNHSPAKGPFPVVAPAPQKTLKPSYKAYAPSKSFSKAPERRQVHAPTPSPYMPLYKHNHANQRASGLAPAPVLSHPHVSHHKGPVITPAPSNAPAALPKKSRQRQHGLPPLRQGPSISPIQAPFSPTVKHGSSAPGPSPTVQSSQSSLPRKPKMPLSPSAQALPPPPPNEDCTSLACMDPYTNTPPGSPCYCVLPMQVGLRLSVSLYTFFPLVSELAAEIAAGVFMKQSQVRIMGANAASQEPEKTIVLIDLVPLGESFDNTTAYLTYAKFWHKQIAIKYSFFGDYEVLYVKYPGLPPSPPSATSSITTVDGGPFSGRGNDGRTIHPLGVDVRRRQKGGLGGSMIAIIVLSSAIAIVLCIGVAWLLLLKFGKHVAQPASTIEALVPSLTKPSGAAGSLVFGSGPSSASLSFGSSIATYTGSAKTFSAGEIERATDNFDASKILGEGGFGRVYSGTLDDGMKVAVKVLKRDDQQGSREFLAEVEMLSRLHHRNLVKLIGICTEDNTRCLVYELIPNGSVESHLHGPDKEAAPLDWGARMKIALGAARGLAYLHEDSSPRVIHRDFKSSNILLEHDFTPKVSDFGLARAALDEGNKHISTRVMGTFGYVAPEYAMTGHLLVKSDVYSYGVVLLELLTGRKPVDMSQPEGQENLVAWARPLLTSKVGLEAIIDPALGSNLPFDSVAKVAAIASMCVQPEVSHRPFMGEVVQALKLVCNECDETKGVGSDSRSQDNLSIDLDSRMSTASGQFPEPTHSYYAMADYDSIIGAHGALSASDVFSTSERLGRQVSGSFRRHSSSGPLRTGRGRQFWQRLRGVSRGSVSEHGVAFRLWPGSR